METTPTNSNAGLTGSVLFYKNPQPLSAEQHGGLGVKAVDNPFEFLRSAHAIPVTVTEFGMLATSYPIIFVGEDLAPIAVMGIRQNENLFVDETGRVPQDFYIPAFARRYPFVFANDPESDRLLLCVDREAPMVTNQPETPFFADGQPTEFTNNAVEFCKEFERQRRSTIEFVQLIKRMDLLEDKTVTFQPRNAEGQESGEPQKLADYKAISEEKLNALTDAQFMELKQAGAIGAIYGHILSLLNWNRVIQRAIRAQMTAQA